MIKAVVRFFVRSCIEVGIACFIASALLLFVAYKAARRFATDTPDGLDRIAGRLASGLGLVAAVRGREPAEHDDAEEPPQLDYAYGSWGEGWWGEL